MSHSYPTTPARSALARSADPPDYPLEGRVFTRLCRRNRARFFYGVARIRRGLDPTNPVDIELLDAVDIELDRLCGLIRGAR